MIYEEAVKPKIRVSIDANEELVDKEAEEINNYKMRGGRKSEYGWSLEPPKFLK